MLRFRVQTNHADTIRVVHSLLFVCTGNQCRSPMAAALATKALAGRAEVTIASAGTRGGGPGVTRNTALVMARRGLDVSSHRPRSLGTALAPEPDLIVALAREHARAVIEQLPGAFPKTFTLKDLVARAVDAGPRAAGEELDAYLLRVGAGRGFSSLAGATASDDVADPIGQNLATYERCAAELEALVADLANLLWPGEP